MGTRQPPVTVTVSGLSLAASRAEVLKLKGQPDFQSGPAAALTHLEYWSDPVNLHPSLSLDFSPEGVLTRVEGGCPEIDGQNVRHWSLAQVERALGPAPYASRGTSFSSGGPTDGGDAFLKYPERRLLVAWNRETGINFILFHGSGPPRL